MSLQDETHFHLMLRLYTGQKCEDPFKEGSLLLVVQVALGPRDYGIDPNARR